MCAQNKKIKLLLCAIAILARVSYVAAAEDRETAELCDRLQAFNAKHADPIERAQALAIYQWAKNASIEDINQFIKEHDAAKKTALEKAKAAESEFDMNAEALALIKEIRGWVDV